LKLSVQILDKVYFNKIIAPSKFPQIAPIREKVAERTRLTD
jgi:hypothetical protein